MMGNLDKTAFEYLMNQVDKKLSTKGVPVMFRSLHAYHHFNPTLPYIGHYQYDNSKSPYEGRNVMETIEKWYREHYSPEKVHVQPLGRRPIMIRSEVFEIEIPAIFNTNPDNIDLEKYIKGTNKKLFSILGEEELVALRVQFNTYYVQASNIALLITNLLNERCNYFKNEVKELIYSARRDLNNACDSILSDHLDTNLWSIQQSVEKVLKSLLLIKDRTLTSKKLKKMYSHDLEKLMQETLKHINDFKNLSEQLSLVNFTADVRYESTKMSKYDAIYRLNYAYAVVNKVVSEFLREIKKQNSQISRYK